MDVIIMGGSANVVGRAEAQAMIRRNERTQGAPSHVDNLEIAAQPCCDAHLRKSEADGRLRRRYVQSSVGTSVSAPTIAAGAIDFADFYKVFNGGSSFIDNPGVMVSNLLLMGDRQIEGGKSDTVYSNLWGAGRFKMRKADAAGLDNPAIWKNSNVCVEEGEVVPITVNSGNPLNADVDDFKAVIYWYDRQHESGLFIGDIDLDLVDVDTGLSLVSSASVFDEKERVYHPDIGGTKVRLDITGFSVNSDLEGCGANSMKVYYAYFYEDDDRDDGDGPGLEIDPE